jgi:hypothetical protein
MVDVDAIHELLNEYFDVVGEVLVDPDTGVVHVQGHVKLIKRTTQLPVQFGTVAGNFSCSESILETLTGAPHSVYKDFACGKNRLTSLEGGPRSVGGAYYASNNQLTSLVGAATHVGRSLQINTNPLKSLDGMPVEVKGRIWLDYDRDLPLLRLLEFEDMLSYAPDPVRVILDKYKGEDKPGALKAAVELIKAGYRANAKW